MNASGRNAIGSAAGVVYRASVFDPLGPDAWTFHADGAVCVRDGRIVDSGEFDAVAARQRELLQHGTLIELDGLLSPGFFDVHIHWVQHAVRGRFSDELLVWLQTFIWPEERRYELEDYARAAAARFYADMLRAGTVGGLSYSSVHKPALAIAMAQRRGCWKVGDVVMPRNAPDYLTAASTHSGEELAALAQHYGPGSYVITPRFAVNCDADLMAQMGTLAQHGGYAIQTHLAETVKEVALVKKLFPAAQDYTDVYDRAGLLRPGSVLGHCIQLADSELARLRARGVWIAHCPSSNEALDSGVMVLARVRQHGVPWALASDVGAGPSHSLLHVMQRCQAQHAGRGLQVTPQELFYRATLAGAECMGVAARHGNLQPGKQADFVLLPRPDGTTQCAPWLQALIEGDMAELESRVTATWLAGEQIDFSASL